MGQCCAIHGTAADEFQSWDFVKDLIPVIDAWNLHIFQRSFMHKSIIVDKCYAVRSEKNEGGSGVLPTGKMMSWVCDLIISTKKHKCSTESEVAKNGTPTPKPCMVCICNYTGSGVGWQEAKLAHVSSLADKFCRRHSFWRKDKQNDQHQDLADMFSVHWCVPTHSGASACNLRMHLCTLSGSYVLWA